MVTINDIGAIQLRLASPEEIREWSHGEVTRPETINYRTLKAERDGLFCERIFGPTRDYECYCGKYKRSGYRGMKCEKCGVEILPSRVRRERMGHIALASPVSHIWFVRGIPSRMAILLGLKRRDLERVIYYAAYIVTSVDEERRTLLLQGLEREREDRIAAVESQAQEQLEALRARLQEELEAQDLQVEEVRRQIREETEGILADLERARDELLARLAELEGQKAPEDLVFAPTGEVLVAAGETVTAEASERLRELVREGMEQARERARRREEEAELLAEAEKDRRRQELLREMDRLKQETQEKIEAIQREYDEKRDRLEDLRPLKILTDSEYYELRSLAGTAFEAGMGAEAILQILRNLDLDQLAAQLRAEIHSTGSRQKRKKAIKQLRIVEAFRSSGNRPEWMILTVLPVIPPDLRPMVQLDGGRFATSDLNDLYRRVINRNNRLKRLLEMRAPEIIIRNERRMLQEAVDALIDNGRRGRAVSGRGKRKLKSLSDMLKGKRGCFRQNLLGKRVDYSGRSVIVVGPELRIDECGLPKKMALELFKPFVMHGLVRRGIVSNIKTAKRMVERMSPLVWEVLEEVVKDRLVLLNRAPSLHRLSIQAFKPVLIDGSAIQLHPLVCAAFNADFDGDQMAVHVPLSEKAQEEARERILSAKNLLSPAHGEPIITPTHDVVLGCFYITILRDDVKGVGKVFTSPEEARLAYEMGEVHLQAKIYVRIPGHGTVETTPGRVLFNLALPRELWFVNEIVDKKVLKRVISDAYRLLGREETARMADRIKDLGFHMATVAGISISVDDLPIPDRKAEILRQAEEEVAKLEEYYRQGVITDQERYNQVINVWQRATDLLTREVEKLMDPVKSSVAMMANSGARGNISQIRQMAGMRGLMNDPAGRIIELPIRSNFREGLSVLEYFVSTHGGRKGLADTALRTADAGYLTRRLVDVAQDVIVNEEDCGTEAGIWMEEIPGILSLEERILGRIAAAPVVDPRTGETIVERNEEIDEEKAARIAEAGITRVYLRSPMTCETRYGLCRLCYGRDLATRKLVELGEAVGIIAAQSIGEPGTQLTLRTFHTGGVAAGKDITRGLPRVQELFEARHPKGGAVLAEIDGVVEAIEPQDDGTSLLKIVNAETFTETLTLPAHYELTVREGQEVREGEVIAVSNLEGDEGELRAPMAGKVYLDGERILIRREEREERQYRLDPTAVLRVQVGDRVYAGQPLTEGSLDPQQLLEFQGREAVQRYLLDELQQVYHENGVTINDRHFEVVLRQMSRWVHIEDPGDTDLLPGELVDRFRYEEVNAQVLAEGGEPATARDVLLGITKAALNTESWLAAASFQETTRVLTEAAVEGKVDYLRALKENVIIGKLIPAGTGYWRRVEQRRQRELARQQALEEASEAAPEAGSESGEGPAPQEDAAQ